MIPVLGWAMYVALFALIVTWGNARAVRWCLRNNAPGAGLLLLAGWTVIGLGLIPGGAWAYAIGSVGVALIAAGYLFGWSAAGWRTGR